MILNSRKLQKHSNSLRWKLPPRLKLWFTELIPLHESLQETAENMTFATDLTPMLTQRPLQLLGVHDRNHMMKVKHSCLTPLLRYCWNTFNSRYGVHLYACFYPIITFPGIYNIWQYKKLLIIQTFAAMDVRDSLTKQTLLLSLQEILICWMNYLCYQSITQTHCSYPSLLKAAVFEALKKRKHFCMQAVSEQKDTTTGPITAWPVSAQTRGL